MEAALVLVTVITVILSLMYFAFYAHDTLLVEAMLKETADLVRIQETGEEDGRLQEEAVKRAAPLFCIGQLTCEIRREGARITVRAEGKLWVPGWVYGNWKDRRWELEEKIASDRPQEIIRKRGGAGWKPGINEN